MNCPKCGKPIQTTASFCEYCGCPLKQEEARQPVQPAQPAESVQAEAHYAEPAQQSVATAAPEKKENMVTGIVGALLGAALGGGCIILLSQLGYVAALSGLVLAVCTLKGYELLGGKLSKKGMVICIVLMLVTPYIADRLDWAIVLMNEWSEYGITLGEAFAIIPELVTEEAIEASAYYGNLAMIYLFVLLGAFSTVRGLIKKKK